MSDEEECDYMSEDFLTQCTGGTDVKPGLQKTKAQQREHLKAMKRIANHEEMQRNKKIRRNIKEIEEDKREEGLAQSIAEPSNKGFAMLAKMGYKAGSGLGKEGGGRLEPVGGEGKKGREGLGRDTALRELGEAKCRILEVIYSHGCRFLRLVEFVRLDSVPWWQLLTQQCSEHRCVRSIKQEQLRQICTRSLLTSSISHHVFDISLSGAEVM